MLQNAVSSGLLGLSGNVLSRRREGDIHKDVALRIPLYMHLSMDRHGETNHMTSMRSFAAVVATALSLGTAANAANIVEIASGDERFSTLVAAVSAAGLVDALQGPGPFTVFAPVNDAFAALPAGTVETLLKPENKGQLTNVLLYHVDDRKLTAEMIPHGSNYFKPLLTSERLCITNAAAGVSIADGTGTSANVVIANIQADNGVIHVIDKVLLPGTRPACH